MTAARLDHVGVRTPDRVILADVSLALRPGELVVLIGPNGAGKSTLLRVLAGLLRPTGEVFLGDAAMRALDAPARARRVAYLAQGGLIHWGLTVRDIVALGRLPFTGGGRLGPQDAAIVARVIAECGLEDLAARPADELSGGERARALFARALAVQAPLLLVDEPIASLDPAQQIGVMNHLRAQARHGRAVVAVLHDLGLALRYADRIVALDLGRVVADAPPADIVRSGALDRLYGVRFLHASHGDIVMTAAADE